MEIPPPLYKRSLSVEKLSGTHCESCDDLFYGEIEVCTNCGRQGKLETIKLPWEGKVYSSSTIHKAQQGFEDKLPYTTGTVELTNGVKVPALFDHNDRMIIGEEVKAKIGRIRKTQNGLVVYRPVWERRGEYSKPKPRINNSVKSSDNLREVGIEGYGVYIPRFRIKGEEVARVWGENPVKSIKSFPSKWDETGAYAMNATLSALKHSGLDGKDIEEIIVGSESHPYAVKPTATIVAGLIDSSGGAVDTEFACKAATEGMKFIMAQVENGFINYGLAIGADSAQAKPNDDLEYFAADGGVAFIIGKNKPIARLEGRPTSYTTDTPDFWRPADEPYPDHSGRFTGEPAYFAHMTTAAKKQMEELELKPEDYDYFVSHQPNIKFPMRVGRMLGFKDEQINPGIAVDFVGNLYSASSPLGLAKVLDEASSGERILLVSYGSGAGSDAFSFITTPHIDEKRGNIERSVKSWIGEVDQKHLQFRDYATYARFKGLYKNH